jgi:hypothetical protein
VRQGGSSRQSLNGLAMANQADGASQRWSKEKPTVAGWYWWRQSRNDVAQPCFVYWAEQILYLHRCWAKYPDRVLSDVRGGEWQGPITPHDQEAG